MIELLTVFAFVAAGAAYISWPLLKSWGPEAGRPAPATVPAPEPDREAEESDDLDLGLDFQAGRITGAGYRELTGAAGSDSENRH